MIVDLDTLAITETFESNIKLKYHSERNS